LFFHLLHFLFDLPDFFWVLPILQPLRFVDIVSDMSVELKLIDRKFQQAELIAKLGALVSPLLKVCEAVARPSDAETMRLKATVFSDFQKFANEVYGFAASEPGANYGVFADQHVLHYVYRMRDEMTQMNLDCVGAIKLRSLQEAAIKGILMMPVNVDSRIHEAPTPFQTYCFVKSLCLTAGQRLDWLDRYFDSTVFYRFLLDIRPGVAVTLVTSPSPDPKNKRDNIRYSAFMDVSKLFAEERGPTAYRLVTDSIFHDRWLRSDNAMYALGGSVKELDQPFTISNVDPSPANMKTLDDLIAGGTEIFGPRHPVHP
jgi:hypothetical protein